MLVQDTGRLRIKGLKLFNTIFQHTVHPNFMATKVRVKLHNAAGFIKKIAAVTLAFGVKLASKNSKTAVAIVIGFAIIGWIDHFVTLLKKMVCCHAMKKS